MREGVILLILVGALVACGGAEQGAVPTPTLEPQSSPVSESTTVTVVATAGQGESGDATQVAVDPASLPLYLSAELTDVRTGEAFRIADLTQAGHYVLVETMAVWCSTCLRQQRQIQAYEEDVGEGIVSVALDIDIHESRELLLNHTEQHGFDWYYAISPPDVSRAIGEEFGQQFLNPPNAPMLLIRPDNSVVPLPFGVKEAAELASLVEQHRLPD